VDKQDDFRFRAFSTAGEVQGASKECVTVSIFGTSCNKETAGSSKSGLCHWGISVVKQADFRFRAFSTANKSGSASSKSGLCHSGAAVDKQDDFRFRAFSTAGEVQGASKECVTVSIFGTSCNKETAGTWKYAASLVVRDLCVLNELSARSTNVLCGIEL